MTTVAQPFRVAERFIQLRKKWDTDSWMTTIMRFNEVVLTPLISLFLFLIKKSDIFGLISSITMTYKAWSEWIEYCDLKFKVQSMFLHTIVNGGPFIVTNDREYMPYVWADGVMRTSPDWKHHQPRLGH